MYLICLSFLLDCNALRTMHPSSCHHDYAIHGAFSCVAEGINNPLALCIVHQDQGSHFRKQINI